MRVTNGPNLAETIADYVAETRFLSLDGSAVTAAKQSILDTMGVCLAATGLDTAALPIIQMVREDGGKPESTIFGFGEKVPASAAALANGALAHSLDFDDRTPWGQHSGSSIVPAVLALSEKLDTVSGEELVVAVAIGQDLFNRFRRHVVWEKDWNFSSVIGIVCATAACAKLLGLSREETLSALAIASMEAGGTTEIINTPGGSLRGLYASFPARGAVTAALLALRGLQGVSTVFDGRYGLLNTFFRGAYDRNLLVKDLGTRYLGGQTIYKKWPVVGVSQSHLIATIRLVTEHDLKPEEIAAIRPLVGDYHRLMCTPLDIRRRPRSMMDARFSLPFIVAVAAVQRDARLSDFRSEALEDPRVLEMADKVEPVDVEKLDWELEIPVGVVEIETQDGHLLRESGHDIPGSPGFPLSWDALEAKFADCASNALTPHHPERIRDICGLVRTLEGQQSVQGLVGP